MTKQITDNSVQVRICQEPGFYYHGETPKGLGVQEFCVVCERYKFKSTKCKVFVQGCRVHKESNFLG
jgi:hypothetical protein